MQPFRENKNFDNLNSSDLSFGSTRFFFLQSSVDILPLDLADPTNPDSKHWWKVSVPDKYTVADVILLQDLILDLPDRFAVGNAIASTRRSREVVFYYSRRRICQNKDGDSLF